MEAAPVIYKNVVFYSDGKTVFALDVWPLEDLDQDGNPDDGIRDSNTSLEFNGQDVILDVVARRQRAAFGSFGCYR